MVEFPTGTYCTVGWMKTAGLAEREREREGERKREREQERGREGEREGNQLIFVKLKVDHSQLVISREDERGLPPSTVRSDVHVYTAV